VKKSIPSLLPDFLKETEAVLVETITDIKQSKWFQGGLFKIA